MKEYSLELFFGVAWTIIIGGIGFLWRIILKSGEEIDILNVRVEANTVRLDNLDREISEHRALHNRDVQNLDRRIDYVDGRRA